MATSQHLERVPPRTTTRSRAGSLRATSRSPSPSTTIVCLVMRRTNLSLVGSITVRSNHRSRGKTGSDPVERDYALGMSVSQPDRIDTHPARSRAARASRGHGGRAQQARLDRPRHQLARVQPARPARGARRPDAAPRARKVPRDLRVESGRVLHETDDADPAALGRHEPCGAGAARQAVADPGDDRLDVGGAGGLLHGRDSPAARRTRNPAPRLGRADRSATGRGVGRVRHGDLAGADAAEPRRRASVPVRLEPLDLLGVPARRPGQRRARARSGQGAERAAAMAQGSRRDGRVGACLRRARSRDRRQRGEALPRDGDRDGEPVQGLPRRRGRAGGRGGRQQTRAGRAGGAAAPLRAGSAPRDRAQGRRADDLRADGAVRAHARGRLRAARAARLHDAVRDRRARHRAAARSTVDTAPADRARVHRDRHLLGDPRGRHHVAPAVRQLLRRRGEVHPRGRGRSPNRLDQDDRLPGRRRHPVRPVADPRRRSGKAGRLRDRAERPFRRDAQPSLVARTGEGRSARHVRRDRLEDPQQGGARRPSGGRRRAQLRTCRHRQLPHPHGEALRRRRVAHGEPGGDTRRRQPLPLPHRPVAHTVVPDAARRTDAHAGALLRAHRARDRESRGRASGPDRLQDEPARRQGDLPAAGARLAGRRADRPDHSRVLLSGARRGRPHREHPHPLDHRPLPRAFAHLPFRRRLGGSARGRVSDRLGRLDAPKPLRARRSRRADPRAASSRPALGDPVDRPGRPPQRLAAAA